jgi:hypothetical protein
MCIEGGYCEWQEIGKKLTGSSESSEARVKEMVEVRLSKTT